MYVWLADLQPHTQEPSLELFGQPRARGEATNEEYELFPGDQNQSLMRSRGTNRTGGNTPTEVIPDGVHGRLDGGFKEPRNLCAVCVKV